MCICADYFEEVFADFQASNGAEQNVQLIAIGNGKYTFAKSFAEQYQFPVSTLEHPTNYHLFVTKSEEYQKLGMIKKLAKVDCKRLCSGSIAYEMF